ncbi:hypothetical protein K501DRAFT_272357 [Backusella circina FSU 941]|nr:hypothetical protein K501DRAFT_272357 [Backusella circina FSU 941]
MESVLGRDVTKKESDAVRDHISLIKIYDVAITIKKEFGISPQTTYNTTDPLPLKRLMRPTRPYVPAWVPEVLYYYSNIIGKKLKYGVEFDLFVAEVKPTEANYAPNKCDLIKINLELISMLDELISYNVADPVVFCLLVRGFECQLFRINLDHDGFYFSPVVQAFFLPHGVAALPLLSLSYPKSALYL